uniref:Uncharacterized protein n=1 Tax=Timema poppense TaxID=170557 RepID=A0A7R9DUQ4_TIMPO|nr:unnamed protein product [Timema poppensis]
MSVVIPKPEGLSQRRKLVPQEGSKTSTDDDAKADAVRVRNIYRLFNIHDAPVHLLFNPYIRSGYRGYLPLKTCVQR